jgi:HSP20 family molecular chaperone IbpA
MKVSFPLQIPCSFIHVRLNVNTFNVNPTDATSVFVNISTVASLPSSPTQDQPSSSAPSAVAREILRHLQNQQAQKRVPRWMPRMDSQFDKEKGTLSMMLELPGLKRDQLTLQLAQCPFSETKQLTLKGRTESPFASAGGSGDASGSGREGGDAVPAAFTHTERRFGEFKRTIVVPLHTRVGWLLQFPFASVRPHRAC